MNQPAPKEFRWPLAYAGRHRKPDRGRYAWWLADLAIAYGLVRLSTGR